MKNERKEILLRGIPASPGIAVGPVLLFRKEVPSFEERSIEAGEVEAEIERMRRAVQRSMKELQKIYAFAEQRLGNSEAKIFEAQLMILGDVVLFESIEKRVRGEHKNSEYIIHNEIEKYRKVMASSNDEYTRERAHDVEDLRNRIIRNLQEERLVSRFDVSAVVVTQNLSAADALILSRNDVLAYLTEIGGVTSHTALLARALNIPSVVGIRHVATLVQEGDRIIVDGYGGIVVINPSEETSQEFEKKKRRYLDFGKELSSLRDLPSETKDGRRVELSANIELEQELEFIKRQGAEGIGLYRSETLLLGKEVFPSEDEQFAQYKLLADTMFPRPVVIRTFDIGGDKMMAHPARENNPFLGWRGIRVMLDKQDIFLDQLRAILRASSRKNIRLLFPMVSDINEVRRALTLVEKAKDDLQKANVPFDPRIPVGVMIEVPSAAVTAEDIAKEVNFLSIGTNDLIQYLLAVDRSNEIVSDLYQEFHPAVVRFLRRIIDRGKEGGAWVGMCGEMAGDPLATVLLLGLGLDEFSVVPSVLPEIKKIIRSVTYRDAKRIAKKVLTLETKEEIDDYLRRMMQERFPDVPIG